MIQLTGKVADNYRNWLQSYRDRTGQEPGPIQRTEAFFCARSKDPWDRPTWVK